MKNLPKSYPFAIIIAVIAILPVGVLFSLASDDAAFFDTRNITVLMNTLALMGLTVAGAVMVGVPLALLTAYVSLPLKRLWLILFAAPLAMPSYLGAFTLYFSFGRGGEIESFTGLTTPSLEGLWGAGLVMTLYTYPFVMMTTRSALLSLDASQINAARTLGLSLTASIWRIVLPRVVNSIAAGALLAALYALSDFGTPA
ncbi:MAG: ABC transporter permease subunit, partial [Pseudomonadota bacterium]|nr:ABC transporter permease subunit [Pseudomonadota bacterium]